MNVLLRQGRVNGTVYAHCNELCAVFRKFVSSFRSDHDVFGAFRCGLTENVLCGSAKVYDRMGMTDEYMEILGNKVPSLTIPVKTGRNLAVSIEVAAMINRQKKMGYNAAQELLRQLGMVDDLPPETIKKDTSDEY